MKAVVRWVMMLVSLLGILISTLFYLGYHRYFAYQEARKNLRSIESDFPILERQLARATGFYPLPLFWLERGKVYLWRAMAEIEFGEPLNSLPYLDRARLALLKAIEYQPVDYEAFWELSKVYFLYNYPVPVYADKGRSLCREAVRRHPFNEFLNINVLQVFFEQWGMLDDQEKTWLKERIRILSSVDTTFLDKLKSRWKFYHRETATLEVRLEELGL